MRSALVLALAVAGAGCDFKRTDDAPDPVEVFENVAFPLVAGVPVVLRGTLRGDTPADSVVVTLRDPDSGCVSLFDDRPECVPLWRASVPLPSGKRPQILDTSVSLPADVVSAPTDLEFTVMAYGLPLARGHGRVVRVLPPSDP